MSNSLSSDTISRFAIELEKNLFQEGWGFDAFSAGGKFYVEVSSPEKRKFWIEFADHRSGDSHGKAPHICDRWLESKPMVYKKSEVNQEMKELLISLAVLKVLTITYTFKGMKESLFPSGP